MSLSPPSAWALLMSSVQASLTRRRVLRRSQQKRYGHSSCSTVPCPFHRLSPSLPPHVLFPNLLLPLSPLLPPHLPLPLLQIQLASPFHFSSSCSFCPSCPVSSPHLLASAHKQHVVPAFCSKLVNSLKQRFVINTAVGSAYYPTALGLRALGLKSWRDNSDKNLESINHGKLWCHCHNFALLSMAI